MRTHTICLGSYRHVPKRKILLKFFLDMPMVVICLRDKGPLTCGQEGDRSSPPTSHVSVAVALGKHGRCHFSSPSLKQRANFTS